MNALDMFLMGYEDLIPLKGKVPIIKDWVQNEAAAVDVSKWVDKQRNIGLLTAKYPAIDCDITNPEGAMRVMVAVREVFGTKTPIRVGQEPKFLALTRLAENSTVLTKSTIPLRAPDGTTHAIELLGHGQQFAALGIHPDTGLRYKWNQPLVPPSALPEITAEKFGEFMELVLHKLKLIGWEAGERQDSSQRVKVNPEQLLAPSMSFLRSAVRAIPNGEEISREMFIHVLHGVKASTSPEQDAEGFAIWQEWTERGPEGRDPGEARRVWADLKHDNISIGWEVIRGTAERVGWDGEPAAIEKAKQEFGVSGSAPPESNFPLQLTDVEDHSLIAFHVQSEDREYFTTGDADWFVWDGKRWEPDRGKVEITKGRIATQLALIADEFENMYPTGKKRDKILNTLKSVGYINTIFARISMNMEVYRRREHVNDPVQHMYMLNTPNGTYDLRTMALKSFNPEDYITQITGAAPDFSATCSEFLKFLTASCGGDKQLIEYVLNVLGSALTTDMQERLIWFLTGDSGTGKSTLLKHMHAILGDYAGIVPQGALIHGEQTAHQSAVAAFRDKRFLHGSEIDRGHKWNVSLLKSITGNEVITARRLYHEYEEFNVVGKFIVAGNETPTLPNVDSAMRARLRVIQFVAPDESDPNLDAKLAAEYPAILALIMTGAMMWINTGYPYSEAVNQLTEEYFREEDLIGQFRDAHFLVTGNPDMFVSNQDLFTLWEGYTTVDQRREQGLRDTNGLGKAIRGSNRRLATGSRRIDGTQRRGIVGMQVREKSNVSLEALL